MTKSVLGIVGVGLIGGSIGMRARRNGALVVGYDTNAGALAAAIEAGAIDRAATREELYALAGTVVLAAYADAIVAELERLAAEGPIRAFLVVDIASVKVPIVPAGRCVEGFVATHPMAGIERSGVGAARADLFEGKTWAYVPSGNDRQDARASAFIASFGAVPLAIGADEHDRIVAYTSHFPQLIAWSYAKLAHKHRCENFDALMGATSRELLRLGASELGFWRSVMLANANNIEPDLREIATALLAAADALAAGDVSDGLLPFISRERPL